MSAKVIAVYKSAMHTFSKKSVSEIQLITGIGVEGDAHAGKTVKHRSRVRQNPTQPNLRQVHLIHTELYRELALQGFFVHPGDMGENISTAGIDLLGLPQGAKLYIGEQAIIEITGLRNPCNQLNNFLPGLMQAVLAKDENGNLIRSLNPLHNDGHELHEVFMDITKVAIGEKQNSPFFRPYK